MAGNAFEALVGAIFLDQGYDAVVRFMEKRILAQMINIDKVAFKEVNFKSKLLEWTQKNRVSMDYSMLQASKDEKGSPVFGYVVTIEGVEGGKGEGYSKKEAQQIASRETLQRLRREPQFIDAIFQAKSERTKMEEEPTMAAPNLEAEKTAFIIPQERTAQVRYDEPEETVYPQHEPDTEEYEFDLSDITHNPAEQSREEIIAAAEAVAFQEAESLK
jgi:ribonuclease-3